MPNFPFLSGWTIRKSGPEATLPRLDRQFIASFTIPAIILAVLFLYYSTSRVLGVALLVTAMLFLTSCDRNVVDPDLGPHVEENGLTREINELVPDTLLARMIEMGMQIHRGPEPPSIEGVFHISPLMLLESNVPGDPSAHQFPDYHLQFTDQDNQALTVTTDYVHGPSTGVGLGTFIVGSEDAFSVFADITLVLQADTARVIEVYSGTMTAEGIEDFYFANFMLDNGGRTPPFIPDGTGRVAHDEDGFSPRISELPTASVSAKKAADPTGASTLFTRVVQEH